MHVTKQRPRALAARTAQTALMCLWAPAQAQEYFDYASYAAQVTGTTLVSFDAAAAGSLLDANHYAGLNIAARRIAVVDPQDFAPGLLVGGQNVNSQSHGISASIYYSGSRLVFDNGTDDFQLTFSSPATAAGLWIGNLGATNSDLVTPTTVRFFDANDQLLASEVFTQAHEGLIGSGANNRVFYGLVSVTPIAKITVFNGSGDFDGVILDDVQWASAVPEPGTWLLLLAGVGVLGLRSARRSAR